MGGVKKKKKKKEMKYTEKLGKKNCLARTAAIAVLAQGALIGMNLFRGTRGRRQAQPQQENLRG